MSEINISGIPNLGIPAMGGGPLHSGQPNYAATPSGLENAYASRRQVDAYLQNQQNIAAQNQAVSNSLTGNLTQDPAKYAAIGAAYGRATGGFGGGGGGGVPSAPSGGGSVFETGTSAVPYTGGPFMSASPGRGIGSSLPTPSYSNPFNGGAVGNFGGGGNFGDFFSSRTGLPSAPIGGSPSGGSFGGSSPPDPFFGGSSPISNLGGPFQSASAGGGIGSNSPRGVRDRVAAAMMGAAGNHDPGLPSSGGGSFTFTDPPLSGPGGEPTAPAFGGLPNSSLLERFRAGRPSPMGGASPTPPTIEPPASFEQRWGFGGATPTQLANQPALDAVNQFAGRGVAPETPQMPASPQAGAPPSWLMSPPTFNERFNEAPSYDPNSFANRFGAGRYFNPGTPSEYYTGSAHPNPPLPQGFSPIYGVDNPGGALPRGYFR